MVVSPEALTPSPWLVEHADLLPRGGRVLDVACGKGRHALWLAARGFDVHAIDRNPDAIERLNAIARDRRLNLRANVIDLEIDPPPSLGTAEYDAVLGFNYLHRPLMPALREALKPGGRLFYETFTTRQAGAPAARTMRGGVEAGAPAARTMRGGVEAGRGHPRNPAFLLKDGELALLIAPLRILRSREGEFDGRFIASIVAERLVA